LRTLPSEPTSLITFLGRELRAMSLLDYYSIVMNLVCATEVVKRMKGTSGAIHVMADNGWHYVVKPPSIGRRAMINEWLGAKLFQTLGLRTADVRPIKLPRSIMVDCWSCLDQHGAIGVASAFPVDPSRTAIYDFLPESMSNKLSNLDQMVGALAVDLWTGKVSPRHCVFYREASWWACFVDHKGMFGGVEWQCSGITDPRNPATRWAYDAALTEREIAVWAHRISSIRPDSLRRLFLSVPDCWNDATTKCELLQLCELLLSRQSQLPTTLRKLKFSVRADVRFTCDTMHVTPCLFS
jgi:hypothetical protein